MRHLALCGLICLSGCTASLQPFPASVSAKEFQEVLAHLDKNDRDLAKAITDMTISLDERLKKLELKK